MREGLNMAVANLKLLVDVPSNKVPEVEQDFKDGGYTEIKKAQQSSGTWSVAAAKCS